MSDHLHHLAPGLWGAMVSLGMTLFAFFDHSLPVIRWFAALVGIIAGVASLASVIRHWNSK